MSPSTSSQELEICGFLFDPTRTLTPQCSFLAARLVGMFLKIWKMPSNPPHSPPPQIFYQSAQFWHILMLPPTSNYYHGLFSLTTFFMQLLIYTIYLKTIKYHHIIIRSYQQIKYEYNLHSKKLKLSASECFKFV